MYKCRVEDGEELSKKMYKCQIRAKLDISRIHGAGGCELLSRSIRFITWFDRFSEIDHVLARLKELILDIKEKNYDKKFVITYSTFCFFCENLYDLRESFLCIVEHGDIDQALKDIKIKIQSWISAKSKCSVG